MLALTSPSAPLRLFEIEGDAMEPALRGGDFLMVAACGSYQYETVYLLETGDGECPYLAQGRPDRLISLRHPNPKYSEQLVTRDEFDAAVRAMSVAEVRVQDRAFIQAAGRRMAA